MSRWQGAVACQVSSFLVATTFGQPVTGRVSSDREEDSAQGDSTKAGPAEARRAG